MKKRLAILTILTTLGFPALFAADLNAQYGGDKTQPPRGEGGRGEAGRGGQRGEGERGGDARGSQQRGQRRNGLGPGVPGGQGVPGGMGRPGSFDGGMMLGQLMKALPLVKALDADSDGELSATEIENASKTLLKLDSNGDGKISAEELKPNPADVMPGAMAGIGRGGEGRPGMGGEMLARMFEQTDTDGDGMLSGEEIPERLQAMITRIDKDGDGKISKEEIKQIPAGVMERMREGQGAGSKRGGDEGEGPVKPRRPN